MIGTAGAEALAQLLEPQVTADGQWTYNDGLEKLDLSGESPCCITEPTRSQFI